MGDSLTRDDDLLLHPPGDDETAPSLIVIGAGIIGLAIAHRLQAPGRAVLVLDREGVAAGASRGNAGAFAFSDILPLASPGIISRAPGWLLDPLGPLALRPAYLPQILPWLWKFWRASRPAAFEASVLAQVSLMRLAAQATPRLLEAVGALGSLQSGGNLHLYESEADWKAAAGEWALKALHGIDFEHLRGREQIAALQPGLSPALAVATFVPGWQNIDDPLALTLGIARAFTKAGGRIRLASALALEQQAEFVGVRLADGRLLRAPRVVVAAGAWSHRIARSIGDRIPLETERGYNTTLPRGAFDLRLQLSFPRHGFVVSPIAGGVRVGGAVELGGLQAPPNFSRADALLAKARRFLPELKIVGGTQWMGFRPSLPDSLPAIGAAAGDARVFYAFGHGHLGLTQAAATAELVRALIDGHRPGIDLAPFDPRRFGNGGSR